MDVHQLASFELCRQAIRGFEIVIVEDPDVGKLPDSRSKIRHDSRKALSNLLRWYIVSTLGDAHGYALFRNFRSRSTNEAQHNRVTRFDGFHQEFNFVANRIGEDGLEDKTFTLLHKLAAQRMGDTGSLVGAEAKRLCQFIGINEAKPRCLKVSVIKRGFAGSIRSGERDDDRSLVERESHPCLALVFTLLAALARISFWVAMAVSTLRWIESAKVSTGGPATSGCCLTLSPAALACLPAKSGSEFWAEPVLLALAFTAWNWRFTKRPTVRLPSSAIRTRSPGFSG